MRLPIIYRPLTDRDWLRPERQRLDRRLPLLAGDPRRLLAVEIARLGAAKFELGLDVPESQIRVDGIGLHVAAVPVSPAVEVEFLSRYGRLHFRCDRYSTWQRNVVSVAELLRDLHALNSYGTAGRQYAGFTITEGVAAQ